ncbi:hypothetical protein SODALDRAFT_132091 [Sodiomyces alkalinus F11]|uniref:Uncharacterized protein n=1 Tax=Sodiomyces alkalinus (strain CBS 110278 / VKM F-3762 / F11) TaxID=1314773 RepID=A0A3N2PYV8_SODAK|nr:hypothetical protein SODALDRAFT_132091 [Sodiomyces alkalinus F11]ROT39535.1 hypothetical protein SODALDRAFT_132091 [Sodiomyces alkalinus F11]
MSLLDNSMLGDLDPTPMNLDDTTASHNGVMSPFNQFNHHMNNQIDDQLDKQFNSQLIGQLNTQLSTPPISTGPIMYDDAVAAGVPQQSVSQLTPAATVFSGTGDDSTVGGPGAGPSPQSGRNFTPQPATTTSTTTTTTTTIAATTAATTTATAPATNNSSNPSGGSTLTEFTKRRNWPAKVVEELRDFLQILDANGRIRFVSPSILGLTGYTGDEITDKFIKDYVHPDDVGVFVAELNESIATANPLRIFYRFRRKDGSYAVFEAVGHAHIASAKFAPNPHNKSAFCQAVFMMARPYPTKNAALLDSFLEHKIENERLRRRIAQLRREEEVENEESQRQWMLSWSGRSDTSTSVPGTTNPRSPAAAAAAAVAGAGAAAAAAGTVAVPPPPGSDGAMQGQMQVQVPMQMQQPQPPLPLSDAAGFNPTLTRDALERVANSRPDSLTEKMARYEGSHADTIEMLTGLRYVEGERSRGITTGVASPALIKGDAGIAIPAGRDFRAGDKKKKQKTVEEYVCTDCGTLDSPEWRKGPNGPKTLCNACGLRWAKKEKKNKHNGNGHATGEAMQPEPSGVGNS